MEALDAQILAQGSKIREMKAAKAAKEAMEAEVATLLDLKKKYKEQSGGKDWAPPASDTSAPPASKAQKKEKDAPKNGGEKKEKKKGKAAAPPAEVPVFKPPKGMTFYPSFGDVAGNMKCWLLADALKVKMTTAEDGAAAPPVPRLPALSDKGGAVVRFGANAICMYLEESKNNGTLATPASVFEFEENQLSVAARGGECALSQAALDSVEKACGGAGLSTTAMAVFYPGIKSLVKLGAKPGASSTATVVAMEALPGFEAIRKKTHPDLDSLEGYDYKSAGLQTSLKLILSHAIATAVPQSVPLKIYEAIVVRCNNPAFGDFQCNNSMEISKKLKVNCGIVMTPKQVADKICESIPSHQPLIASTSTAPNGFINIHLSSALMGEVIASIIRDGPEPPCMQKMKIVVDFSSPNIAKEMHVGHLRSTIIGDSVCRILEYCGHEVHRTNHVGDWGTQFGMLITYLLEAYPDILTNPPNISDLTAIYKASKKRFDEDEAFKETSRLNVVKLQGGDAECRKIWNLLCDISRLEFQKVYDLLDVRLEEVGESFYNPMIPGVIDVLEKRKLAYDEDGMLIIKLPHFTIPLIVRKSDGGYGYDSTDMAAVHHRLFEKKADWIIYITDAGQASHFYMVFDAAKACGWLKKDSPQRLDHIGFGVVCGEDGKRFKTRSSETVRLIDLLNEAKARMASSMGERVKEGKSDFTPQEIEDASGKIGYGAVKYFDLKQNPSTNYIFNYDRMLDTKGDTAVYLLFAYARVASILRKAQSDKGKNLEELYSRAIDLVQFKHPSERALAFEVMQFGDTIRRVLKDLLPNVLCQYLSNLCVVFTDFVTKCNVLNSEEVDSRLLLCETTRRVMFKCFELLGIEALDRI